MRTSPTIGKIVPALLAAQRVMGGAKKGATNPYFKSRYADLGSVLEACKDILNANGITILQPHSADPQGSKYVTTALIHESGEWIAGDTAIVCKENDPQAQGSAITYARRYGLQSLLSMPAEDDDGEGAMSRNQPKESNGKDNSVPKRNANKPVKAAAQGPAPTTSKAVAPVPGEVQSSSVPEAPEERADLMKMIKMRSEIATTRKLKTLEELKAGLKSKYGAERKEDLTDEQAKDLCNELGKVIYE